jgi:lipopolysaccharide export system ATP-binding protein
MVEGKLFRQGTAEDLANDPMVRKVYLGQNFQLRKARATTPQ